MDTNLKETLKTLVTNIKALFPTHTSDLINDGEGGSPATRFVEDTELPTSNDFIPQCPDVDGYSNKLTGTTILDKSNRALPALNYTSGNRYIGFGLGDQWRSLIFTEYNATLSASSIDIVSNSYFDVNFQNSSGNTTYARIRCGNNAVFGLEQNISQGTTSYNLYFKPTQNGQPIFNFNTVGSSSINTPGTMSIVSTGKLSLVNTSSGGIEISKGAQYIKLQDNNKLSIVSGSGQIELVGAGGKVQIISQGNDGGIDLISGQSGNPVSIVGGGGVSVSGPTFKYNTKNVAVIDDIPTSTSDLINDGEGGSPADPFVKQSEIVQSDLNENDDTKNEFVKNRTHYKDVYDVIVSLDTLTLINSSDRASASVSFPTLPEGVSFNNAEKWILSYTKDGVDYEYIGMDWSAGQGGAGFSFGIKSELGHKHYFSITISGGTPVLTMLNVSSDITLTNVKFIYLNSIKQIYDLYIPDTIARTFNIPKNNNILNSTSYSSLRMVSSVSEDSEYQMGTASVSLGWHTQASGNYQLVFGKLNKKDTNNTYVEIVGNGSNTATLSNARTLDWYGNEVLAGGLTVGGAIFGMKKPISTTECTPDTYYCPQTSGGETAITLDDSQHTGDYNYTFSGYFTNATSSSMAQMPSTTSSNIAVDWFGDSGLESGKKYMFCCTKVSATLYVGVVTKLN